MVFTNVYNPRSHISRKDEFKKTLIKKGVSLGANCTVICGVTLGEFSFIAAGAVVTKNVKPYALIAGVPGKQIGWISQYGEKIPLPLSGSGEYICKITGQKYILNNDKISID